MNPDPNWCDIDLSRIEKGVYWCINAPMIWDDYRLILALHREKSLRAAAKVIGVNHSTLSRRLAALDPDLFEKTPAGYQVTTKGMAALDAAKIMEQAILEAERKARAGPDQISGVVTLSIPQAIGQFLLLDDFAAFGRAHPQIRLNIKTGYAFADLDRSEADIVIRATQNPPDHLVGRRLFPYYIAHYCAPYYLQKTPVEERVWIVPSDVDQRPDWIDASAIPEARVSMAIDDATMRHRAAIAGHGLIRGACYMDDPNPGLVRLPGSLPIPKQDIWVLTHPDLRETPRIKLVMRFLIEAIIAKRDLIEGKQPDPALS